MPKANSATKRPLVPSGIVGEFGAVDLETDGFGIMDDQRADPTYVPGFSEMRLRRDKALGAVVAGELSANEVPTLPVNCRWSRRTKRDGTPDQFKLTSAKRNGYRMVTKDDLGKNEWLLDLPVGAEILADGTIAKGDTVLTVTDAKTAARNAYRNQQKTLKRVQDSGLKANSAGVETTSEVGKPIKGPPSAVPMD